MGPIDTANPNTSGETVLVHGLRVPASDVKLSIMHGPGAKRDEIHLTGNAYKDTDKLKRINEKLQAEFSERVYGKQGQVVHYPDAWDHAIYAMVKNPQDGRAARAIADLYNSDPSCLDGHQALRWYACAAHLGDEVAQNMLSARVHDLNSQKNMSS